MKKLTSLLICLFILFSLTACNNAELNPKKEPQKTIDFKAKYIRTDGYHEDNGIIKKYFKYSGEWLNKEATKKYTTKQSTDLVITEIYADCFFANYVIPTPRNVKVNGAIADKWCIGDQVLVTYDEWYTDDGQRMECNLIKIEESDFVADPNVAYKPVIYLYPEQKTDVTVKLSLNGELNRTEANEFIYILHKTEGKFSLSLCFLHIF